MAATLMDNPILGHCSQTISCWRCPGRIPRVSLLYKLACMDSREAIDKRREKGTERHLSAYRYRNFSKILIRSGRDNFDEKGREEYPRPGRFLTTLIKVGFGAFSVSGGAAEAGV